MYENTPQVKPSECTETGKFVFISATEVSELN